MKILVEVDGRRFEVEVREGRAWVDGEEVSPGAFSWIRRGREIVIERDGVILATTILPKGTPVRAERRGVGGRSRRFVEAPLPGLVRSVLVEPGESVSAGQPLLTLDAMKLENEIQSPVKGLVAEVRARAGAAVDRGEVLVVVEEEG
jgi:biotin carboxyl carrier protein